MTGPEKRIEEVLMAHEHDGGQWCSCYCDVEPTMDKAEHRTHVAAAVIEALGLKQESSTYEKFETKSESGGEGNMRWGGQTSRSVGWRTSTRLVSEWVEQ